MKRILVLVLIFVMMGPVYVIAAYDFKMLTYHLYATVFTSSGNLFDQYGNELKAENVFDQSDLTYWVAPNTTPPSSPYNAAGQWVEMDFGSFRHFNYFQLVQYKDHMTGYRIEYWDGTQYLTAYTGAFTSDATAGRQRADFPTVYGSKVRLYITSSRAVPIIYRFTIYNKQQNPQPYSNPNYTAKVVKANKPNKSVYISSTGNLAAGKSFSASSVGTNTGVVYEAWKAFDGNYDTCWGTQYPGGDDWLEVNLGNSNDISRMEMSLEEDWYMFIWSFSLEYWNGTTWNEACKWTRDSCEDYGTGVSKIKMTFPTVTTTKVRLRILATSLVPIRVKELGIYSDLQ